MKRFECEFSGAGDELIFRDNKKDTELSIFDAEEEILDGDKLTEKEIADNINAFSESTINSLYEQSKLGVLDDDDIDFSKYSLVDRAAMKTAIREALQEKYLPERSDKKTLSDVKKNVAEKKLSVKFTKKNNDNGR